MRKEIKNQEIKRLFENGNNCIKIAKIFNCDPETIRLRLKKEGVNTSKQQCDVKCVHCLGKSRKEGKTKYNKQRYLCLECNKIFVIDIKEQEEERRLKHEQIKMMYLSENLSTTQIGEKLGISSTVPQRILKKYKITRDIGLAKEIKFANKKGLTHDEYLATLPIFKKYRNKIRKITNRQQIDKLLNYEKRGKSGISGAYHLDYKYSILEGFKNDVDPEIIGNIKNLEFIPWQENINKKDKCSITLEELLLQIKTVL